MKRDLFPGLYLGLGFAQAAHSIEEVLTGQWLTMAEVSGSLNAHFSLFPRVTWDAREFAAINLVIVAVLVGLSPFVFLRQPWAWKLARIVAVIETINGAGHITAALVRQAYFPGCISGVLLIAFSLPLWAFPKIRRIPSGTD
jgi:hypothetical protein